MARLAHLLLLPCLWSAACVPLRLGRGAWAAHADPTQDLLALLASGAGPSELAAGCAALGPLLGRGSGPEAGPILRALDAATTHLVMGSSPSPLAATECIRAQSAPAVFNREYTLMLNRSTHVIDNLITVLRDNPRFRLIQEMLLQSIAGVASYVAPELTPVVAHLGGFDVLFNALHQFAGDADVMMSAWRGMSDHSYNPVGAAIIAHHGGHMQGIHFLVGQMRAYPKPGYAEGGDHLTLKYEILQNVNGLLISDDDGAYTTEFVKAGLLKQIALSMRVESSFRGTQDTGCMVMEQLLMNNSTLSAKLVQLGTIELIGKAMNTFREDDPTPWNGRTFGSNFQVVPGCANVLLRFVNASSANVARMVKAGIPQIVADVRPDFRSAVRGLAARLPLD